MLYGLSMYHILFTCVCLSQFEVYHLQQYKLGLDFIQYHFYRTHMCKRTRANKKLFVVQRIETLVIFFARSFFTILYLFFSICHSVHFFLILLFFFFEFSFFQLCCCFGRILWNIHLVSSVKCLLSLYCTYIHVQRYLGKNLLCVSGNGRSMYAS